MKLRLTSRPNAAALLVVVVLTLSACEPATENTRPYWSDGEKLLIASLHLSRLDSVPASASNRVADNPEAAEFGRKLFFDTRLSGQGELSCASCHQPDRAFTDGLPTAMGVQKNNRNTQGLLGVSRHNWFYWDGRKDSLWAQALVPFEAPDEMGGTRLHVLRVVADDDDYRKQYQQLFGELPAAIFSKAFAVMASPWGNTEAKDSWYRIDLESRNAINAAYANIGKAIAAFERQLALPSTRFDAFASALSVQAETDANALLSEVELAGLKLFVDQKKTHCLRCHNGALFSNHEFHNTGTGSLQGDTLDFGRYLGIQAVVQDAFNCLGEYSDAKPEQCDALRFLPQQIHDDMRGAYKTPTLRYLNMTAPYLHDGRAGSLEQVLAGYLSNPANGSELPLLLLSDQEQSELLAFLHTLAYPL